MYYYTYMYFTPLQEEDLLIMVMKGNCLLYLTGKQGWRFFDLKKINNKSDFLNFKSDFFDLNQIFFTFLLS